ncbi:hypothetical protein GCM10023169_35310 [Georgenia halophila]|uniref:Thioesterase domain-containing protein n=1 Tax=Georgenia halophila TaxID=620889 RepID=A0ABP8LLG9_9MICO
MSGRPGSATDRHGRRLGLRHREPGADGPVVELSVTDDHLNGAGIAHGGVLFSALDEAVAIVANAPRPGSVLVTATIHCLRPALPGDDLSVWVETVKAGRTVSVYEARLTRADDLLAVMTAQTASTRTAAPDGGG